MSTDPTMVQLPDRDERQSTLTLPDVLNPWHAVWFGAKSITNVPEHVMGWLVSNGWEITDTRLDESTAPPTPYYAVQKLGLNPYNVLNYLCNAWTTAAQNAQDANSARYNEVVEAWREMADDSNTFWDSMRTEQNEQVGIYLADLDTYLTAVDTIVAANVTAIDTALTNATTEVGKVEDAYDDYEAAVAPIAAQLYNDWIAHAGVTRTLLTDLGAVELQRINDEYNAKLTAAYDDLTNRGLYSSAVYADLKLAIEGEWSKRVTELNESLAREKLQNEHTLYGQQVAARAADMGARDRIAAVATEVFKYKASAIMGNASTALEHKHKAVVEMMNLAQARLSGLWQMHSDNVKLMQYQLDERNKLLIGLYGFVERREDVAPSWESMANMVAGLANAGGGWLSP